MEAAVVVAGRAIAKEVVVAGMAATVWGRTAGGAAAVHLVELEGQLTILKLRDCGILPAPGLWGMGLRARCLAAPLLCGDGHQYGGRLW